MAKTDDIGYPPDQLNDDEIIAKVKQNRGSTFDIEIPESHIPRVTKVLPSFTGNTLLVALSPKLRNKFFVRRNGLVVAVLEDTGKVKGEIINIVADPRQWKNFPEFPPEYNVAKTDNSLELPPSLSDEEEEEEDEF
ncbi:hypothetical protein DASB73_008930 [Starmerella bacillaris]|uniref:Uncharacterized protein n=1 Tax=Starmerella bacillaris TaxID=1247836 RepID=A0AAV5REY9_STABA|nr:hypothetical protein DASB73_008930 [Starmerella bacillaris]